ncbi:hypothetical protein ScalyP_jg6375 [Parmales sp. scaly parma]|nr:hypothetical protein ScalyP_jg6375 [Parmales sp. scaly parma]
MAAKAVPAAPAAPGIPKGMGKMALIIPVMLFARKLDSEDPNVVLGLRVSYGVVQLLCLLVMAYCYKLTTSNEIPDPDKVILVPPKAGPFDQPDAKKKFSKTTYGTHCEEQVRAMFSQAAMSVAMTVGLHYYKGMVMGLAIQCVMAPFNLWENPAFQKVVMKSTERCFDEVLESEFTEEMGTIDDGSVEDVATEPDVKEIESKSDKKTPVSAKGKKFVVSEIEETILDTWDEGSGADLAVLMDAVTETNINQQTSENRWTALMVVSGLNNKSTKSSIKHFKSLGADVTVKDKEGWNALHWACFHNNATAAELLMSKEGFNCGASGLYEVVDFRGDTALELAKNEGNSEVATALRKLIDNLKKDN